MQLAQKLQNDPKPHIIHSLSLLRDVIEKYTIEKLAFSFNGGKDCTVLLHLLRAVFASMDGSDSLHNLKTIYFHQPNEFPKLAEFRRRTAERYGITIKEIEGSFFDGLNSLLKETPIRAIVMGQRRIDPHAKHLTEIAPTDDGWPDFDRVNPLLAWSYQHVWGFLRTYDLEYCELYDCGYTSLGPKTDTLLNPALSQCATEGKYSPAYCLEDGNMERFGRPICRKKGVRNPKTAAILVNGDAILQGLARDTQSQSLCHQLHDLGISVESINIVKHAQIKELAEVLTNELDVVFACGSPCDVDGVVDGVVIDSECCDA